MEIEEITIKDFFELSKSGGTFEIDTPDGWQEICSLVQNQDRKCYNIVLDNGYELECSENHKILTKDGWKTPKEIQLASDSVCTDIGWQQIVAIESIGNHNTYDLSIFHQNNRYYSNGIVSHNCGKSLVAKAVANEWKIPYLEMDMGAVFQSHVGDSEANIREALSQAESMQPCCLVINEVEKGLAGAKAGGESDSGVTKRVFGTITQWLSEKKSQVFVICTANDMRNIPPEFYRAGRFDEIWFVDLPSENERKAIFDIHLSKRGRSPKKFDIKKLATMTSGFSGAEIENVIEDSMWEAFDSDREFTTQDILASIKKKAPRCLYKSESELIEYYRTWAEEHGQIAGDGKDTFVSSGKKVKIG